MLIPLVSGAFSFPFRPLSTFTVFSRVAEDYAPFNVDVTTEEPAEITRSVLHAIIVAAKQRDGVTYMPSGDRAGGVAFLNVFGVPNSFLRPALVFYDNLASQADYFAEATSHELGHNFGLSHDGQFTFGGRVEYYRGMLFCGRLGWLPMHPRSSSFLISLSCPHCAGDGYWAPIMGVG